ncbi:oligopeptide/dipeptide ABC transporter ATP-binding protein [Spiroplasma tabanidicola]|uniref:Oligopeptide ABC transporter ATP-binding protein n=1 Tax=Spiroplasma tabanidicola TaxID=324079 RepID=A0A6I6C5M2_9MOLU|nr:oligopeptide/dipeptide ABC transporter ATP-binding protein [Spiroplasma tabanidicola]QGS52147.1 oligopeptide ABC transporter ATP-binding protein [Spiroplasma tabanidicola]
MEKSKILAIRNLEVKFQVRQRFLTAIRNISLDIYDKEVLAIVGESGSGKSVITKTFTGMLESNGYISDGSIIYSPNQESIDDKKAYFKKPINLVNFQRLIMDGSTVKNIVKINKNSIKKLKNEIKNFEKLKEEKLKATKDDLLKKIDKLRAGLNFSKSNTNSYKIGLLEEKVKEVTSKLEVIFDEDKKQKYFEDLNFKIELLKQDITKVKGISLISKILNRINVDRLLKAKEFVKTHGFEAFKNQLSILKLNTKINFINSLINNFNSYSEEKILSEIKNIEKKEFLFKEYKLNCLHNFKKEILEKELNNLQAELENINVKKEVALNDAKLNSNNLHLFSIKELDSFYRWYEHRNYHFKIEAELKSLVDDYWNEKEIDNDHFENLLTDWNRVKGIFGTFNKLKAAREIRKLRGKTIATIFQDPMTSLNPLLSVGFQITEVLRKQLGLSRREAKAEAINLLGKVGIPEPEKRYKDIPGRYSGGMRQRVVIAIALACRPKILICDEPTTALDVTIQAQILDLIRELQEEYKFTVIFITHDLGVVAKLADRIAVMYAGQIVEYGTSDEIFHDPKHPYTWALLSSLPQLSNKGEELFSISGTPPSLFNNLTGDAFAPRNNYAMEIDYLYEPPMFKVSDTHYAKTWLLDKRAPKINKPEAITNLKEKIKNQGKRD